MAQGAYTYHLIQQVSELSQTVSSLHIPNDVKHLGHRIDDIESNVSSNSDKLDQINNDISRNTRDIQSTTFKIREIIDQINNIVRYINYNF